jgi:sugar phosphate isomerase/epimerase
MANTIGVKVGSKAAAKPMDQLILDLKGFGVKIFELVTEDIQDSHFYQDQKKEGIRFGIHTPHAWGIYEKVALGATLEPHKSIAQKWFRKTCELAEKIGVEYNIFHADPPNRDDLNLKFAENAESARDQLIGLIKTYQSDIPLLLETMPSKDYLHSSLDDSRYFLKFLLNIGFCFDVEHAYEVNNNLDDAISWYLGIAEKVRVFHICDFDPEKGTHLPLGEGIIDYQKFFGSIKLCDDQIIILEIAAHSPETVEQDIIGSYKKIQEIIR